MIKLTIEAPDIQIRELLDWMECVEHNLIYSLFQILTFKF